MNISRLFRTGLMAAIALLWLGVLPPAHAANSTNNPAGAGKTNAVSDELPIPLSVFDVAVTPTKDPFFPLSTRQPFPQPATNAAPAITASSFNLKGVDWSERHKLALLNNRTVAIGEDAEVTTSNGKVHIHCLDIRPTSILIRISTQTEPVEIFLRQTAR